MRRDFYARRLSFGKEEISFALDRDTFRGRLIGFLTPEYRKRKKLLMEGEVVLGYAFKEFLPRPDSAYARLYVLYSPESIFEQKPALYAENANLIETYRFPKKPAKAERGFKTALIEPYADAMGLEVPTDIVPGRLLQLFIIDYRKERYPETRLGYNFFIHSPAISRELMMLAPRFVPLPIYKAYSEGDLK